MTKKKLKVFWGGFVDGKLDEVLTCIGWGGWEMRATHRAPAIFSTRKEARKQYQDVRRIEVRERSP